MFATRTAHAVLNKSVLSLCVVAIVASAAHAQRGGGGGAGGGGRGAAADTTTGFAIRNPVIVKECSSCHKPDTAGHLSRISYMRKTPEGWEMSVRRMVTLNGVSINQETARAIVKYLSDSLGLAPAEVRPARWEAERRIIDFTYAASAPTENTCRACHSMGRVMLERRTRSEWNLLIDTHRGLYPTVERQGFGTGATPDSGGSPTGNAVTHLATAFPLRTPEWTAWSANMRPARLDGSWIMSGTEPGKGQFFGKVTVTKGKSPDEFTTHAVYRYASGGPPVTRDGSTIIYTGFQWRGKSKKSPADSGMREVMLIEPGWQQMSGRWFTGAYDELGMDVSLTKLAANPIIAGITPTAFKRQSAQDVTIFGANLPRDLQPAAIDFGPGIKVDRVVRASPDSVTVHISVDSNAVVGDRDLFAADAWLRTAAVVYDRVTRIAVTPLAGMARVGGVVFPKGFQQFDAVAYANGPDGRPETDDDIEVGPVQATWALEEYVATYDDDDIKFVGAINQSGFFTPSLDGPNPARRGSRNNVGDVWVVATYQPPGRTGPPLKARAELIVTVPLYARWSQGTLQK